MPGTRQGLGVSGGSLSFAIHHLVGKAEGKQQSSGWNAEEEQFRCSGKVCSSGISSAETLNQEAEFPVDISPRTAA